MYEVYSQQKSASPLRGIIAASLVLAICTGVGWLLIDRKQAGHPVEIDEPILLDSMNIRLQPPRGWTRTDRTIGDVSVTAFTEPEEGEKRVLRVFSWPAPYSPSIQRSLVALPRLLRAGLEFRPSEPGHAEPIGPLSGWQLEGIWAKAEGQGRALTRVAWCPTGRTCLVSLCARDRMRNADRNLVDAVCRSIELADLRLSDDLGRESEATGIHFSLPAGARVVEPNSHATARIVLIGDTEEAGDWLIKVSRTWPRPGDDLESLVATCRIEQLQDMTPARHIKEKSVGGNQAWHTAACMPKGWETSLQSCMQVWAVRHPDGPAAMIVGLSAGNAQDELHETCLDIARSLSLEPSPLAPEAGKAMKLAETILEEISRKGVGHWWPRSHVESWFRLNIQGDIGFHWTYHKPWDGTASGKQRFDGGGMTFVRYGTGRDHGNRDDSTHWRIDSDAGAFRFRQWAPGIGRDDNPIRLSDRRETDSDKIKHYIEVESKRYQGTMTTPEYFLPDPIFELALYLVARRPSGQAAMFAGAGSSEKMLVNRMCRSLGRLTDEDDGDGGPVYGVTVQLDCESKASRYVFDGQGRIIRTERDEYYVAVRSDRGEVEDLLGDPSIVSKALERRRNAKWLEFGSRAPAPTTRPKPRSRPEPRPRPKRSAR